MLALGVPALLFGLALLTDLPVVGAVMVLFGLIAMGSAAATRRQERGAAERRREQERARRDAEKSQQAHERAFREARKSKERARRQRFATEPVTASSPLPKKWHRRAQDAEAAAAELERAIGRIPCG